MDVEPGSLENRAIWLSSAFRSLNLSNMLSWCGRNHVKGFLYWLDMSNVSGP